MTTIPSSFDMAPKEENDLDEMSFGQRIIYHCKQQPLVPIGCILTTGAVVMAAQNIRLGNSRKAQNFFRWRIAFQGATLLALVAGSFLYDTHRKDMKSKEELMREKAKMREKLWIQELERRDEEAKSRRKRAELARQKTKENEQIIQKLEDELKDLESKVTPKSK
ncbi:Respiratory supercomplex factor 1, mitochondrial [Maudiozyma exigua]|uniref:Respiratory supercomplex factor 1, mitochondrial n=1 Tax=Maudiozyma exigua TaxID=34358 RepID=A0A9P6WDA2_MAUEX|nr:Respiratory supercomplex factor 1, mitochondrial [Kazachstania exigua]